MMRRTTLGTDPVDATVTLLRAAVALLVQRERREGVSMDELAATLSRSGLPHAEVATVLDTTHNGARVAARRGREKSQGGGRRRRKVAPNG